MSTTPSLSQHPKIRSAGELVPLLNQLRSAGKRIVFTNGCFDLLHDGHRHSLRAARALGDVLVVGLNSDASVRRLKGPGRPVQSQDQRAAALAALDDVDFVVIFEEDTAGPLIQILRPDILVKGADYKHKPLPEKVIVESYGGRVVLVDLLPGISTTQLLQSRQAPDSTSPTVR